MGPHRSNRCNRSCWFCRRTCLLHGCCRSDRCHGCYRRYGCYRRNRSCRYSGCNRCYRCNRAYRTDGCHALTGTVLPGELVTNGTMEQFTDTVPTGWTVNNEALAGQATAAGQVHSGLSAVQLASGAQMRQTLAAAPGSYYRLSFYAQGVGDQPAVTGRIIFTDAAGGESIAADVSVRSQDMVKTAPNFGYYQVISPVVPENVTTVTVYLEATGRHG